MKWQKQNKKNQRVAETNFWKTHLSSSREERLIQLFAEFSCVTSGKFLYLSVSNVLICKMIQ
jgi:hypothetical protein